MHHAWRHLRLLWAFLLLISLSRADEPNEGGGYQQNMHYYYDS